MVFGDGFGDCRIPIGIPQIDQHDVPQPADGASERVAFGGIRNRVVGPAGLPLVSSSLGPRFGAPAP